MNITYTAAEARIVKHNNVSNPCHLFNFPVAWAWHPGDATLRAGVRASVCSTHKGETPTGVCAQSDTPTGAYRWRIDPAW